MQRFENGFTMNVSCGFISKYIESIHFITAGATTAWLELPRITGSNGSPTATLTRTVTVIDTPPPKPSANSGAIARSVIGKVIFDTVFVYTVLLDLHLRKKKTVSNIVYNSEYILK